MTDRGQRPWWTAWWRGSRSDNHLDIIIITIVTQERVRSAPIPVTRTLGQEQEELLRAQLEVDKLELCVSTSLMTSDLSKLVVEVV